MPKIVKIVLVSACAVLLAAAIVTIILIPKDKTPTGDEGNTPVQSEGTEPPVKSDATKSDGTEEPSKPQPDGFAKKQEQQVCFALSSDGTLTPDNIFTLEDVKDLDHYYYYTESGEVHRVDVAAHSDRLLFRLTDGMDSVYMEFFTYENSLGDFVFAYSHNGLACSALYTATDGKLTLFEGKDALAIADNYIIFADVYSDSNFKNFITSRENTQQGLLCKREVYFISTKTYARPQTDMDGIYTISYPIITIDQSVYAEVYAYRNGTDIDQIVVFTLIDGTSITQTASETYTLSKFNPLEGGLMELVSIAPSGGFVRTNQGTVYPKSSK